MKKSLPTSYCNYNWFPCRFSQQIFKAWADCLDPWWNIMNMLARLRGDGKFKRLVCCFAEVTGSDWSLGSLTFASLNGSQVSLKYGQEAQTTHADGKRVFWFLSSIAVKTEQHHTWAMGALFLHCSRTDCCSLQPADSLGRLHLTMRRCSWSW